MNVKEYMIMAMMIFDYALPIIKSIHLKIGYKRKKCYGGKGKFMLKTFSEICFDIQRIKMGLTRVNDVTKNKSLCSKKLTL